MQNWSRPYHLKPVRRPGENSWRIGLSSFNRIDKNRFIRESLFLYAGLDWYGDMFDESNLPALEVMPDSELATNILWDSQLARDIERVRGDFGEFLEQ